MQLIGTGAGEALSTRNLAVDEERIRQCRCLGLYVSLCTLTLLLGCQRHPVRKNLCNLFIGADFHRAMVATAAGEKLLIG